MTDGGNDGLLYYEDLPVGRRKVHGSYTITPEEARKFAETFDPRPVALDPGAAREAGYDDTVVSPWLVAAVCMRMLAAGPLAEHAMCGAIGVDDLRWHEVVSPGATVTTSSTVTEKRVSESRPEMGHLRRSVTGVVGDDPDADPRAVSWVGLELIERRPDDGTSGRPE